MTPILLGGYSLIVGRLNGLAAVELLLANLEVVVQRRLLECRNHFVALNGFQFHSLMLSSVIPFFC